jgi:hypothetical protein
LNDCNSFSGQPLIRYGVKGLMLTLCASRMVLGDVAADSKCPQFRSVIVGEGQVRYKLEPYRESSLSFVGTL